MIIWTRHWLDKIKVGLVPKLDGLYFVSDDLSLTLAMISSQHRLLAGGHMLCNGAASLGAGSFSHVCR